MHLTIAIWIAAPGSAVESGGGRGRRSLGVSGCLCNYPEAGSSQRAPLGSPYSAMRADRAFVVARLATELT
jgi:hypothetical protein